MALCLKARTFKTYTSDNVKPLSILIVFLVLLSSCTAQQDPPSLFYFKPLHSLQSSSNGVFRLQSSDQSTLQLFGENLNTTTVVKLTESEAECDEGGELYGVGDVVTVNESNSGMLWVQYQVTFPFVQSTKLLYFCIKNDYEDYRHQGNSDWLTVEVFPPPPPASDWLPLPVRIIAIFVLMMLSGMFSGLNLGLMALDPNTLKIIQKSGTKKQKKYAKVIYRVRRHGNYLLCTLLLGNVLVNSTFTILLDDLASGIYAIIGSTLAIVIFGEIIPQAICSRYGLLIGAYSIWLTYLFMVLTFPLSFPISLILNLILGKEIGSVYNRDQLLELLHVTQKDAELEDYELDIISGALRYKDKTVKDVMTKFQDVFCISIDAVLDFKTIKMIYDSGFSRVPIFEKIKGNIVGVLYLRDLTFIDPDDCTPVRQVRDFYGREPKWVFDDLSLEDMLREFTQGQYHIAIVRCVEVTEDSDPEYITIGVVTLEDIIEEILGREINDEFDQFEDNVTLKPRLRKNMDIGEMMYTTPMIKLSAHQLLAVKQFLLSAVTPFQVPHITKSILNRLLQQDIVYELSVDESQKTGFALYQQGMPASYFTLLLEGCLTVSIGKETLLFEARGFYFFGSQVLVDVIESNTTSQYLPDFTVRPQTNCLVLLVTRQRYAAAHRASQFELGKGQSNQLEEEKGERSEDMFSQEWQAAENQDLQSSLSGRPGLTNIRHLLKTKPLQDFKRKATPGSSARKPRPPHSPLTPMRGPQRVLQFLTDSPGPSRTYEIAEEDEDDDTNGSEKKALLLGMESGYTTTDSIHNSSSNSSGNSSPNVAVAVVSPGDNNLRTTQSLSDLESYL